ncbi:MAG: tRNA 2-thiouridine(34) synthase MnmA [Campylobacter sp.]
MKILMAMSGGVDSAISAKMLLEQGYEVVGCYMKLHEKANYHEKNIDKVARVCENLGIDYHVLDLQDKFSKYVYEPFVNSYKIGKTPNPCALCNHFIKFGELLKFAKSLGCQKLATGHYIRVENGFIKVAADLSKDQSYFVAQVPKEMICDMIFPLGDKLKKDIKELANSMPNFEEFAKQPESTEICFVENTYVEILQKHYKTDLPGNVVDTNGNVVGRHNGYMHYTVGKRRGFEVFGAHEPHFVLAINADKNQIVVGQKEDLRCDKILLNSLNLYVDELEFDCDVKVRYRSVALKASVRILPNNTAEVELKQSAFGVASGQLAVFYRGDLVIGSGFIL